MLYYFWLHMNFYRPALFSDYYDLNHFWWFWYLSLNVVSLGPMQVFLPCSCCLLQFYISYCWLGIFCQVGNCFYFANCMCCCFENLYCWGYYCLCWVFIIVFGYYFSHVIQAAETDFFLLYFSCWLLIFCCVWENILRLFWRIYFLHFLYYYCRVCWRRLYFFSIEFASFACICIF